MGAVSFFSVMALTGLFATAKPTTTNCFPIRNQILVQSLEAQIADDEAAQIRQQLTAVFSQDLAARGQTLNIFEEDDMDFQGFAYREPGSTIANVDVYKGVRFNPQITLDTYALILCHEIGHHLGGAPRSNMSYEGEADYFGNLKCMRRYLGSLSSTDLYAQRPPMSLIARCQSSFQSADDVQICARSLAAAQVLGNILKDVTHQKGDQPSLDESDPKVVQVTDTGHPKAQCRLDTFRTGALCMVPVREELSDTDTNAGACNPNRDSSNRRPPCWFADPAAPILASAH
jgi:hypothetical protein